MNAPVLEIDEVQLVGHLVVDDVFHEQVVVREHDRRIDRVEHLQHLLHLLLQTVDVRDAELTGRRERREVVNSKSSADESPIRPRLPSEYSL